MKKLILLVGPPGSGKTTLRKKLMNEYLGQAFYVSQDEMGKERHLYYFEEAIKDEIEIIIVDRMGFSKEQRERYIAPARAAGYKIEITVLHAPFDVCMYRCINRQNHETIKTEKDASQAVNFFFKSYEKVEDSEADVVLRHYGDYKRSKAVIFDIDGTLANIEHRLHFVRREGKKDWKSFFKTIKEDKVHEWCRSLMKAFEQDYLVVLCSGRPDDYKRDTVSWLAENNIDYHGLYMRKRGDFRQDYIVKEMILDFELLPRYDIEFCVDDRKQVVDMWRSRGLTCLQCAEGDF